MIMDRCDHRCRSASTWRKDWGLVESLHAQGEPEESSLLLFSDECIRESFSPLAKIFRILDLKTSRGFLTLMSKMNIRLVSPNWNSKYLSTRKSSKHRLSCCETEVLAVLLRSADTELSFVSLRAETAVSQPERVRGTQHESPSTTPCSQWRRQMAAGMIVEEAALLFSHHRHSPHNLTAENNQNWQLVLVLLMRDCHMSHSRIQRYSQSNEVRTEHSYITQLDVCSVNNLTLRNTNPDEIPEQASNTTRCSIY